MKTKTVTIVREYDDKGRMVKETRTEVESTSTDRWTYPQPWQQPLPWWQNPVISHVSLTTGSDTVLVN